MHKLFNCFYTISPFRFHASHICNIILVSCVFPSLVFFGLWTREDNNVLPETVTVHLYCSEMLMMVRNKLVTNIPAVLRIIAKRMMDEYHCFTRTVLRDLKGHRVVVHTHSWQTNESEFPGEFNLKKSCGQRQNLLFAELVDRHGRYRKIHGDFLPYIYFGGLMLVKVHMCAVTLRCRKKSRWTSDGKLSTEVEVIKSFHKHGMCLLLYNNKLK